MQRRVIVHALPHESRMSEELGHQNCPALLDIRSAIKEEGISEGTIGITLLHNVIKHLSNIQSIFLPPLLQMFGSILN